MIVANAKVNGLTVATRNEADFYQLTCVTASGCEVLKGSVTVRLDDFGDDNVIAQVPLGIFLFCLDMAGNGCKRFETVHVSPIAGGIATFAIV